MSPERFAAPGLLVLLIALALVMIGTPMVIVAVPLGVGLALGLCAAHEEIVARASRN